MNDDMRAALSRSENEVFVRRLRGCPACGCPTATLCALVDEESGRAFLMCDEVEEGFWSMNDPLSTTFQPNTDLAGWRAAEYDDLIAAGWNPQDFVRLRQGA